MTAAKAGGGALDLLYEIGVEEIPASYTGPALTALAPGAR